MKKIVIFFIFILSMFMFGCNTSKIKCSYKKGETSQAGYIDYESSYTGHIGYSFSILKINKVEIEDSVKEDDTVEIAVHLSISIRQYQSIRDVNIRINLLDKNGQLVSDCLVKVTILEILEVKGTEIQKVAYFLNIPNEKAKYKIEIPQEY